MAASMAKPSTTPLFAIQLYMCMSYTCRKQVWWCSAAPGSWLHQASACRLVRKSLAMKEQTQNANALHFGGFWLVGKAEGTLRAEDEAGLKVADMKRQAMPIVTRGCTCGCTRGDERRVSSPLQELAGTEPVRLSGSGLPSERLMFSVSTRIHKSFRM